MDVSDADGEHRAGGSGLEEVAVATAEFWRGHGVRVAEHVTARQWSRHLRWRRAAALEEWRRAHHERALVCDLLLDRSRHSGQETVALLRRAARATVAEEEAHRRYRTVLAAVNAELCQVRRGIVEGNRTQLAQLGRLHAARTAALRTRLQRLTERAP